jgi:uncharacterized protein
VRPSRYNFSVVGDGDRVALFNSSTGTLLNVAGPDGAALASALEDPARSFSSDEFHGEVLGHLRDGGFLVDDAVDELQVIRDRYWHARGATPVVLTVATTMDCNLGCYYCYEKRSADKISVTNIPELVSLAERLVEGSRQGSLHVDWYGGEPLLNLAFLEQASEALQASCRRTGSRYVASIISNGTEWPADIESFVQRHRIAQVQISFDGLKENHDKRRRYRKGYSIPGTSSFERATALIDRLVTCVRVDLRFNIDRRNQRDLLPFIDFARQRGWFNAPLPAVFQPARLAAYSDASAFMRSYALTLPEFDALRDQVRRWSCPYQTGHAAG